MTIIGEHPIDPELEARIRKRLSLENLLPKRPPPEPPPPKPSLTVLAEAKPSLDLLRERYRHARDELREAERREAERRAAVPDTSEAEQEAKKWREAFKKDPIGAAELMQGRQIRDWMDGTHRANRGEE
jgi:hypothetical protein